MQEWLDNNDIVMHSTHNEAKLVKSQISIGKSLKDL